MRRIFVLPNSFLQSLLLASSGSSSLASSSPSASSDSCSAFSWASIWSIVPRDMTCVTFAALCFDALIIFSKCCCSGSLSFRRRWKVERLVLGESPGDSAGIGSPGTGKPAMSIGRVSCWSCATLEAGAPAKSNLAKHLTDGLSIGNWDDKATISAYICQKMCSLKKFYSDRRNVSHHSREPETGGDREAAASSASLAAAASFCFRNLDRQTRKMRPHPCAVCKPCCGLFIGIS